MSFAASKKRELAAAKGKGGPGSQFGRPCGYAAARGWDPVTGFGTPNFPRMLTAALRAGGPRVARPGPRYARPGCAPQVVELRRLRALRPVPRSFEKLREFIGK